MPDKGGVADSLSPIRMAKSAELLRRWRQKVSDYFGQQLRMAEHREMTAAVELDRPGVRQPLQELLGTPPFDQGIAISGDEQDRLADLRQEGSQVNAMQQERVRGDSREGRQAGAFQEKVPDLGRTIYERSKMAAPQSLFPPRQ